MECERTFRAVQILRAIVTANAARYTLGVVQKVVSVNLRSDAADASMCVHFRMVEVVLVVRAFKAWTCFVLVPLFRQAVNDMVEDLFELFVGCLP